MNENEAIEILEIMKSQLKDFGMTAKFKGVMGMQESAINIALKALTEIQKYRELGTIRELKDLKESNLSGLELAEIAIAVKMLKKYEEIGTINQFREMAENRSPATPEISNHFYICPRCKARKNIMMKSQYCSECGQAFEWKEKDDE